MPGFRIRYGMDMLQDLSGAPEVRIVRDELLFPANESFIILREVKSKGHGTSYAPLFIRITGWSETSHYEFNQKNGPG